MSRDVVYIPMPGEPGALAELSVGALREQLALQGLYVVTAEVMAAMSEQPATAPTRTEAEQRVLDAMGYIDELVLRKWVARGWKSRADVAAAELARRGLKP